MAAWRGKVGIMRGAETTGKTVFRIRDLSKHYETGDVVVRALDRVTLDLFEGEMAVLLGPSGSGKSTLLNIVGGLDRPTTGSVKFKGEELAGASDRQLTA